jgi:hypothetical protein
MSEGPVFPSVKTKQFVFNRLFLSASCESLKQKLDSASHASSVTLSGQALPVEAGFLDTRTGRDATRSVSSLVQDDSAFIFV